MAQKPSEKFLTITTTRRILLEEKNCLQCGEGFTGPKVKKYCTSACSKKASYWRNPEAYKASRRKSYQAKKSPKQTSPRGQRSREIQWRQTHSEELEQLAGQWVVLEGEEIVSHGPDAVQVVDNARARGLTVPYVFFVDDTPEDTIRMGL